MTKQIRSMRSILRPCLLLLALLWCQTVVTAKYTDYTYAVGGAQCDNAEYWTISSVGDRTLQCDTWSGRGDKDGTDMTTPFMEYWMSSSEGTLPDAEIRHTPIEGLPMGQYTVSMRIRCYNEAGSDTPQGNVFLWANGSTASAISGATTGTYNGQAYTYATVSTTCSVGSDRQLLLGINISALSHCNWVAWKDVEVHYITDNQLDLADGTYYIRHTATGLFLNGGGIWGTHATLSPHALPMTLSRQAKGIYTIDCGYNGVLGRTDDGQVYTDISQYQWTLTPTATTGGYTLQAQSGGYLAATADGVGLIDNSGSQTAAEAQWQLLTYAQMVDTLLSASSGQHQDATFLLSNPRFDRNYVNSEWEGDNFATGGSDDNYCAEVWNACFDIHQRLTNIPNGRYRLSVQGYYRWNDNWDNTNQTALRVHKEGTEPLYAELYANDQSVSLQSIASELDQLLMLGLSGGDAQLPYNMTEASRAFTAGLYQSNEVEVEVGNHELVIGVRKLRQDGCDWTIWDNFELTLIETGNNEGFNPDKPQDYNGIDFDKATWETPIDITSLITNAGFDSSRGWHGSPAIGGDAANRNAEKYNTAFDVYQTINGLPDGWYRLTAQGFYRYGSYEYEQHKSYYGGGWEENDANNVYAMYTIPYAVISRQQGLERGLAHLYANEHETPLPSPFDYAHSEATHSNDYPSPLGWVINSQQGASEAFRDGEFGVELLVPVVSGSLRIGVKKTAGYKYDWACWDNFQLYYLGASRLEYATAISVPQSNISMSRNEQRQLTAVVTPTTASLSGATWTTTNPAVVSVDGKGRATARNDGIATIVVRTKGARGEQLEKAISVRVTTAEATVQQLIVNEIQVSNLDMFLDPSLNYGGYVELYNPTNRGVTLDGLWISDDAANLKKHQLNHHSGAVPAQGFALVWFDHATQDNGLVGFKLSMDGGTIYISSSDGTLIASQNYPQAVSRTSYARSTDGGSTWAITAQPTPGSSNSGSSEMVSASGYERLALPVVSHESQLFSAPFTLRVGVPEEATLCYTTDGTLPSPDNGHIYHDGISIANTTVLLLRLFQPGKLPSAVKTCSFILRDRDFTLPVLSVVANPSALYSDSLGIMVPGINGQNGSGIDFPCNWNMEWERLAAFNYISAQGDTVHSQEVAISRFGGWSRSWFPYNFKLKAQGLYEGQKYLTHPFFANKPYQRNKVLQVRNGGNDLLCRIKDAALHNIVISSGLHLDCQDYMPVHTFINGKYIGMLNLREPSNKHLGYSNYGLDTDQMDQMRLGWGVDVNTGSADAFWQWHQLSYQASSDDVYKQICSMVDIDEFVNYMATQIFLGGDDWPGNNCKAFKAWDGKFHIVLFDIDQALRFDAYAFNHITNNQDVPLIRIFLNMLGNDHFRRLFIDTYSIVAGSVFDPERCAAIIDRISAEMDPALSLEGLSTQPTAGYMKQVLTAERRDRMMEGLRSWRHARISTPAQRVKLGSNVRGAQLLINGIMVPTGRFDGTLFAPCTLTATAPEGYTFTGWVDELGSTISVKSDLTIDGRGNLTLTATYRQAPTDRQMLDQLAMPIKVNEVSAGNDIYANEYFGRNDWLELYNSTDTLLDVAGLYLSDDADQPLKYQIPVGTPLNTKIPAGGHLIVWADKLESQSQLHANFKLSNSPGQMVMISSSDAFVSANRHYFDRHPGQRAFVDALSYNVHQGDQSVGRFPDGGRYFYVTTRPTIARTNRKLTGDTPCGEDRPMMRPDDGRYELYLEKGWNWTSHILYDSIDPDELSRKAQRIVSQKEEASRDSRQVMNGTLKQLQARQLYKVQMTQADVYSSDAMHCIAYEPLSLEQGWNWIGYPCNGQQSLTEALAASRPDEGDMIMSQEGFSVYAHGRWHGTLSDFATGKGYLYHSVKSKPLAFTLPRVAVNMSRKTSSPEAILYGVDKHAYPEVMGIIAQLQKDGQTVDADRYTLLAIAADGLCRGFSKGSEELWWLTAYGQTDDAIGFAAIDHVDGFTYAIEHQTTIAPTVIGTFDDPLVLTLSDQPISEPSAIGSQTQTASQTPIIGYYSLSGTFLTRWAASLGQGIYIVRHADGTCRKISIK